MAFRALVEFVLHLKEFRNIDLNIQGIYFIKSRIFMENADGSQIFAHPYCLSEVFKPYPDAKGKQSCQSKLGESQYFKDAIINDQSSSFSSRGFFIKFTEEEIELNDLCHFQIEVDVKQKYLEANMFLEVSLMHFDLNGVAQNQQQQQQQQQQQEDSKFDQNDLAKCLETTKFKIKNWSQGIHEFVPVLFSDSSYFSVVNLMLHSVLLDYRYRVSSLQLSQFAKLKLENQTKFFEDSAVQQIIQRVKENKTASFYQYLSKFFQKIDFKFIQDNFVGTMKNSFENLLEHYNFLYNRTISEKLKKQYKKYLYAPMKLTIPEYVNKENYKTAESINRFNENLQSPDPEIICTTILSEINYISGQVFALWHKYLDLLKISPRLISTVMGIEHSKIMKEIFSQNIIKNVIVTPNYSQGIQQQKNTGKLHIQKANQARQTFSSSNLRNINIEEVNMFPKPELTPIIFEDIYIKSNDTKLQIQNDIYSSDEISINLIVFVHGFQGNSYDMKLLKNYINLVHSETMLFCSLANEESTEGDILEMGQRLGNEVSTYISDNIPLNTLGNFIGHSLGGLIIRAALPYLEEYSEKMFTFMTLSSPHLGYVYTKSKIIGAGIDQYAPFDSARMEICPDAYEDKSVKGRLYQQCVNNIMNQLNNSTVFRIDINFNIPEKSLDTFIGRTAHILFLESNFLLRALVYKYEQYLQ